MRDSGTEPWESFDKVENATVLQKLFVILQSVTKTSTMMIGEVDANDILGLYCFCFAPNLENCQNFFKIRSGSRFCIGMVCSRISRNIL
ncbi:unnamed protein product [Cylicostephanus goldi]|uniref:Uncharacterized protein n=1 Tax=Cylicostephanus goldi TaxID=71465 RepID=A0A3P6RFY9_CYLGO|nr:unnamed protein product [Cylicostephanus goldi]